MSNFECEKCGTICYDTPSGYITGCEHYPADIKKREGEERETMTTENSTDDDSASSACYADGFQFGRELLDEFIDRFQGRSPAWFQGVRAGCDDAFEDCTCSAVSTRIHADCPIHGQSA